MDVVTMVVLRQGRIEAARRNRHIATVHLTLEQSKLIYQALREGKKVKITFVDKVK